MAKSETVHFKAIESVLDRSTPAPKRQIHQTHEVRAKIAHVLFTPSVIAKAHQIALEVALEEGREPPAALDGNYGVLTTIDQETGHFLATRQVDVDSEKYQKLMATGESAP